MAQPLAVSTPGRRSVFDSRYEIVATIGRGRNSVVYEARTLIDLPALPAGTHVALKVFTGSAKHPETNIERMRREATAMLASRHTNVIKLYDFVTTGDLCYLVMEFAERGDLVSFMDAQKSPLTPQLALNLVKQMLFGLRAIHSAGIVHCDIKPENLLFSSESQVKIADFGVSLIPTEKNSLNEITGVGTFDYLAPEILSGGKYSAGSDIYAVGVTLFKLLTMHLPFAGETLTEQIDQKVRGERKALADYVKKLPSYLEQLLDRSLAVNPQDRFQSAEEFQEAIDELIGNAADRGTTSLSAKSTAQIRDDVRESTRDISRGHLSLVPSNDEGIVVEPSLPEVQHGEPQIKTGITDILREALSYLNPFPLLGILTSGPNGPLKSMLATASVVVTIWAASIYISGSGFAMERVAANVNNNSPAPREVVMSSGVLYNLLGENQHVSLIATVSRDDRNVLISTDIPGWTPQLLAVESLSRNGEVTLKSGGIQLTLSTSDSNEVPGSFASGSYREEGSGREGRWVLWH